MKKILLILLTVLMVLPLSVLPAGAESVGGSGAVFEKQNVLTDLAGAKIGDKTFSPDDYAYRNGATTTDMQLLTLFEYGYCDCDSRDGRFADYALYLYIYNPGNVLVSRRDMRHTATLSIGSEDAYEKYNMRLLSYAGDAEHEQLLLKFKIQVSADKLRQLIGDGQTRTYKLSEFEIYSGGTNATAMKGCEYVYSGSMAGYGDGSLTADVTELETLSLDLEHCVWRSDHSPLGDAYKTQLDSVYFSIPNDVFEKYGEKIARIKYHTYKYDSGYVAVFRDDDDGTKAYNLFKPYEGKKISSDLRELPTLCDNRDFQGDTTFCYNNRYNNILDRWFVSSSTIWAYQLSYVLKMPASTGPDSIIETDLQDELADDWSAYNAGKENLFFTDNKADHEVTREIGDKPWTIDTQGKANWFQSLLLSGAYKSKLDNMEDIQPIQIVEASHFSDFENSLHVDYYYKDAMRKAYDAAKARDESLVLFHFDTSDYFAIEVECNSYATDGSEVWVFGNPGFVAKETVYMDFDVIDITFEKDGVYTVLPCVATPIHAIADLETPSANNFSDAMKKWVVILIAIMLIVLFLAFLPVLLPILLPVLRWVLKALVWVVLLPFRLLWWLLKMIGKGITALSRRIRERIQDRKK